MFRIQPEKLGWYLQSGIVSNVQDWRDVQRDKINQQRINLAERADDFLQ